tara:strand:+ start:181 stop:1836 length:1656 start_codon:yes stop_codon:yes gene_type:complete
MVVKRLYGNTLNRETVDFLKKYANQQIGIIKKYIQNYTRKLQLIDAFAKEWDKGELKRLRSESERVIRIDVSEEKIVRKEEKSVRHIINDLMIILNREINSGKKSIEEKVIKDLQSLNRKLKILEKNLALQEKWFLKNQTEWAQNKNKDQLVNLVRREGATLFDIDSTDIKELIFRTNELMQLYELGVVQEDTYQACEAELHRELQEFDEDRLDFSIEKKVKLGGGFKNPVLLVKTSNECAYVAKAFTEKGAFGESRRARKFIEAGGGLIPDIVRVSDNEIVCEKVGGTPIRKILISGSSQSNIAFYTLGKALARIHKSTLNELSFYDPRRIIRAGYTKDFMRLEQHMKLIKDWGVVDNNTYKKFLGIRSHYYPKYLSIIHGDAHLDNFFFVSNPETIIIVDYDDAKPGDPLADVGRVVASIRNWQFKANLNNLFVEEVILYFFRGYKSVLNIELKGTNLYAIRLYLIIIKSSKKLFDKINELIRNDTNFVNNFGNNLIQFFQSNFRKATNYFHNDEIEKLMEIKFCLEQIYNFVNGKELAVSREIFLKAA